MSPTTRAASATLAASSVSSLNASPRRQLKGRKPVKARLRAAHKQCFDHLRWSLQLIETYPATLAVEFSGADEDYPSGKLTGTPQDRALTAIVYALVDAVAAVTPRFIELSAGGERALSTHRGRTRMLRKVRLNIRRRMHAAIKDGGFDRLEDMRAGWKPSTSFWDLEFTDEETEALGAAETYLDANPAASPETTPEPSVKLTKKAVRYVFGGGAPFDIVASPTGSRQRRVKGGRKFVACAAGRGRGSDAELARTAVAQAVVRLVRRFDDPALRDLFPSISAKALRMPQMSAFIIKQVRGAIDAAVSTGGYAGLLKLDDWRRDLVEVDHVDAGAGEEPLSGNIFDEMDRLLAGAEPNGSSVADNDVSPDFGDFEERGPSPQCRMPIVKGRPPAANAIVPISLKANWNWGDLQQLDDEYSLEIGSDHLRHFAGDLDDDPGW